MTGGDPAELSLDEQLDRLRLARTPGVGASTAERLLRRHGSLQALLRDGIADLPSPPPARQQAQAEMDALADLGGRMLFRGEAGYPPALMAVEYGPLVLSVLGQIEWLQRTPLAIVGSRNASGNGRFLAERLAAQASAAGMTVVSGLARGIDTAAHRGGLSGEGSTVAVLGCGVDIAYPPENASLLQEIAARGAVISERPLGAPPHAKQFPRRNRTISGLSWGVIVVEAAERSGSLMTARLALEQGREVMAVPGSPTDQRHRGTNRLIKQGAAMIETFEDVLEVLPPPGGVFSQAVPVLTPAQTRVQSKSPKPPMAPSPRSPLRLEGVEALLGMEPLLVDELIRQCQGNAADVQKALLELELEGRLLRHPGNRVSLAAG